MAPWRRAARAGRARARPRASGRCEERDPDERGRDTDKRAEPDEPERGRGRGCRGRVRCAHPRTVSRCRRGLHECLAMCYDISRYASTNERNAHDCIRDRRSPHRVDDRIRFMTGTRQGRRRHRHGGPGYAFGRRAGRGNIRAGDPRPSSPRSRCTATRSSRSSPSGPAASGGRARARSTPRCSSSRMRSSSASRRRSPASACTS